MADVVILAVSPEAAILNSVDENLPEKTRQSGAEQPRFVLCYPNDNDTRAFWSWPIPPQAKLGTLLGTATLYLHWSTQNNELKNVQWEAKAGFVEDGDSIDEELDVTQLSAVQASTGQIGTQQITAIALSSLFDGVDTAKPGRLVLSLKRLNTIADPLPAQIYLQNSQLLVDFNSFLQEGGPYFSSRVVDATPYAMTRDDFGKHLVIDTDEIDSDAVINLLNNNTLQAVDDGRVVKISRMGANKVTIQVASGGTTTIVGGASPVEFLTDGDSASFVYVHSENHFQIF